MVAQKAAGVASGLWLAGLLLVSAVDAQWLPGGVPLCTANGSQRSPFLASDGAEGAIVSWRDERDYYSDPFGNVDVYAQRVTAAGAIGASWPENGLAVCADSTIQGLSDIISDGAGGAYLAWADWRSLSASRIDIYIQRVTPTGAIAPGWKVNGNPVCTVTGDQWVPRLAPDGAGGTFVVWEDFRVTGYAYDRSQVDLYAQRITPEGAIAPGWPTDGLPVCTVAGGRGALDVVPDGAGGVFIEWADGRNFAVSQADIYALRLTARGEVAVGWVSNGLPICTIPGFQTLASVASDGDGGFIVVWIDTRSAPPNATYLLDYYDIYAQRVAGAGSIAPGWPVNGVPLCTAPDVQQELKVVPDGTGGAIACWSDYRDRFVSASDIYAQRVMGNGKIAPGWPADGVALTRDSRYQVGPTLAPDGMGGALVAFENVGGANSVSVQHVAGSGTIAPGWLADGFPLRAVSGQWYPAAVSDGKGGMILAWEDSRGLPAGGNDIFAMRIGGDYPTPTLIAWVGAEAEPGRVVLSWSAWLGPPTGAQVYRRGERPGWAALGVPHQADDGLLVFEDRTVTEGRYAYRLGYAGPAGEAFTPEQWVTVPGGYELRLTGFSPNPAVREPVVSLSLASREPARLEIFDLSGRAVITREVGSLGPGTHRLAAGWGAGFGAGVYWLRLTQEGKSFTVKGLVVR